MPAALPSPNSANSGSTDIGKLIVCATPIGNLGDITLRVIEALSNADAVLAEDTRVTRKLLNHLGIDRPLERCDENIIRRRADALVARIAAGESLAYVSDAGTPAISDPGAILVAAVREAGLPVEVLPGASAVLTALVASGFNAPSFYFGGYLPRKTGEKTELLKQLADLSAVLVFFESPHRTLASLEVLSEIFPTRKVCLARELTKFHEEVVVELPGGLIQMIKERDESGQTLKGEVVILVDLPARQAPRTHVDKYAERGGASSGG
jgi:16S rRNA (cytidine1402-2'-O)-methyltransferase